MKAKKSYKKGGRTVTKEVKDGVKSRTVTRNKKDGSTVTRSRRVAKSDSGKSVDRSVTTRGPKTELAGFSETTKSTSRKKLKKKTHSGPGGSNMSKIKSVVKKTSKVRPESTGGKSMGSMAARDQVRGESTTRSKVVTRKPGVGRSVSRTVSEKDSYDQHNLNEPRLKKRLKALKNPGKAKRYASEKVYRGKRR